MGMWVLYATAQFEPLLDEPWAAARVEDAIASVRGCLRGDLGTRRAWARGPRRNVAGPPGGRAAHARVLPCRARHRTGRDALPPCGAVPRRDRAAARRLQARAGRRARRRAAGTRSEQPLH